MNVKVQHKTNSFWFDYQKSIITFATLFISLLALTRFADEYAHQQLNQSMVSASISFATARTLDAVISVLQSTGVSVVVELNIGAMLSPLNDLIEKFCSVMTLAFSSLALQKILVTVLSSKIANVIVCLSSALLLLCLWVKRFEFFWPKALTIFKAVVLVRFLLIVTVALNLTVDKVFLTEITETNSAQIEQVTSTVEQLSKKNQIDSIEQPEDKGYFASMKESISKMSNAVVNQSDLIENMQESVEESVSSFMHLMVLFVLKTIIFPLMFLLSLKKLFWRSFEVK